MTENKFVNELVIGFGFLNGIWISVGINPESEIINSFSNLFSSNTILLLIFQATPIILTLISIIIAYNLGGKLGLFSIFLAFISGLFILSNPYTVFLLFISMWLGMITSPK